MGLVLKTKQRHDERPWFGRFPDSTRKGDDRFIKYGHKQWLTVDDSQWGSGKAPVVQFRLCEVEDDVERLRAHWCGRHWVTRSSA